MVSNIWSAYKPEKNDVFTLDVSLFRKNGEKYFIGRYVNPDEKYLWKLVEEDENPIAQIIEHHREYYSIRELLNIIWCLIIHKPKHEYLKLEWLKEQ